MHRLEAHVIQVTGYPQEIGDFLAVKTEDTRGKDNRVVSTISLYIHNLAILRCFCPYVKDFSLDYICHLGSDIKI